MPPNCPLDPSGAPASCEFVVLDALHGPILRSWPTFVIHRPAHAAGRSWSLAAWCSTTATVAEEPSLRHVVEPVGESLAARDRQLGDSERSNEDPT